MKTYNDTNLHSFNFGIGAKDNAAKLTQRELERIDRILQDRYPDGMSDEELNTLFRFKFATVLDWLDLEECDGCGEIHEQGEICECYYNY